MSSFEMFRSDCEFLHMFLKSWNSRRARGSINLNLLFYWIICMSGYLFKSDTHICSSVPTAHIMGRVDDAQSGVKVH